MIYTINTCLSFGVATHDILYFDDILYFQNIRFWKPRFGFILVVYEFWCCELNTSTSGQGVCVIFSGFFFYERNNSKHFPIQKSTPISVKFRHFSRKEFCCSKRNNAGFQRESCTFRPLPNIKSHIS